MKSIIKQAFAVLLSFVILATSLMSCSSTTYLTSTPPGAKIYFADIYKGTTPYKHSDARMSGYQRSIEINKEGYDDFHTILIKKGRAHGWAIVGGIFLLIPFLWVVQYNIKYDYELTPSTE
jgi:hypothetical protein